MPGSTAEDTTSADLNDNSSGGAAAAGGAPASRVRGRHRTLRRRLLPLLAILGPGVIAASAGNDAGGIATYASAGAQFRYRTLFFMLIVTVAYAVVQEMVARLAAFTGKGLAALIREEFSLRWTGLAMGCFAVANLGLVVTEFAGIATAFGLFGVSRYWSVPVAALVIWALVVLGSYRYAERVFMMLVLAFLTYPMAMILSRPHWGEVGSNLVIPHMQTSSAFILLGVALIGTTITPYIQLYEAGAIVDRGIGPKEFHYARIDAIAGAVLSDVVSACIIVATGAAIGGTGPLKSAAAAAEALGPIAGSAAKYLFGLGLLGASALAGAVVPLSTSYALAEAIGVERSVSNRFTEAPLFLGLFTGQIILGALVVLVPGNLITLIINTQVLEGIITPITLAFVLILANSRTLLGSHANGPWARTLGLASVLGVGGFSAFLVLQQLGSALGIH
ncbi:MAG: Nramp family divalent metal transporter [Acidimicrobiales bacterium]